MKSVNTVPVVYFFVLIKGRGPGSSVVIATDYGLGGPGSNPGRDEIFRQSRPTLRPTQFFFFFLLIKGHALRSHFLIMNCRNGVHRR